MKNAINECAKQFAYEPEIQNVDAFKPAENIVVNGMGGSHLAADIIGMVQPVRDFHVVSDYGMSVFSEERMRDHLFIASSYSGNTEEAISFAHSVHEHRLNLAIIAVKGELIDFAIQNHIAYVQLPDTGIQPRSALGFSLLGLARLINDEVLLKDIHHLGDVLNPSAWEKQGTELAGVLKDSVPVIYASSRNRTIAYNWKIKCNETGKIPAFYNVFPELNHNEMNGFDVQTSNRHLSEQFHFLFITDDTGDSRIEKRMHITKKLYTDRKLAVTEVPLEGQAHLERTFNSLLLADWTALAIAEQYGTESEEVPMVEEFKKLIL